MQPAGYQEARSPALAPGQRIGAYAVEARVGEGGMGTVYRARDTSLGRMVALKVIRTVAEEGPSADVIARFLREARLGASLSHPNIVVVYEAGAFGDVPYLAMEWVEGRSLPALVAEPTFTLAQRLDVLDAVADALAYAHGHGVIHRDVKPSNVMLDARGRTRLVDFGIAKRTASFAPGTMMLPTHAKQLLGTPAYMAPEQMLSPSVDARADQFSWGVMAYELLSGSHPNATVPEDGSPFPVAKPKPLHWVRGDVPESFAAIVHRAISYEPDTRFATMDELLAVFRASRAALAGAASAQTGPAGGGGLATVPSYPSYGSTPPTAASTGASRGSSYPAAHAAHTTHGSSGSRPPASPLIGPTLGPTMGMGTSPTASASAQPSYYGTRPLPPMLPLPSSPPPARRSFPLFAVLGLGLVVLLGVAGLVVALVATGQSAAAGVGVPVPSPLSLGPKKASLESFDDLKFVASPPPDVPKAKALVESKLTPCFAASTVAKEQMFTAEIEVAADGHIAKVGEQNVCKEQHPSFYLCTERGKTPKKGFPSVPDDVFACVERALLSTRLPRVTVEPGQQTSSAKLDVHVE